MGENSGHATNDLPCDDGRVLPWWSCVWSPSAWLESNSRVTDEPWHSAINAGLDQKLWRLWRTLMPIEHISRRTLLGSATAAVCLAALSKAGAGPTEWKPRLGILGRYSEANVDFAIQEEFNNMILSAGAGALGLDTTKITDEEIAQIKNHLSSKGMHVSALQVNGNHIASDPAERARENSDFVKAIELAGKLGVPFIGTQSGKDVSKPFAGASGRDRAGLPREVFRCLRGAQGAHPVGAVAGGPQHCHQPGGIRCSVHRVQGFPVCRAAVRSLSFAVADDGSDSNREGLRGQDL